MKPFSNPLIDRNVLRKPRPVGGRLHKLSGGAALSALARKDERWKIDVTDGYSTSLSSLSV